ncbi:hypothetical protein LCI18_001440 [Fusarium solani-melongenae]|uniref:Uncharacterized protein n=1 Tax=Fusarium solani subsp. cucurbitae TaxID=2747967 RepID=A0ACD3YNP1_FUSSC|nr:hypothetical protein LCI18_001440 [Fusarium solani-melongenae]
MRAVLFVSPLFIQLGLSLGLERVVRQGQTDAGVFNPPKTSSFLQLDLRVTLPANVSTPDGMTALAPNIEGGKATGAFEADILPVGAAYERVALNQAGENSFYQNRYIFQTADNETLSLEVDAILHYENNALHGFGLGKFATTIPELFHINYEAYIVEVMADFNSGIAVGEVFELTSCGRRDGEPIKGLLPPGGA